IDLCLERSAGWARHGVGLHGSMSPAEQARVVGAGDRPRVVIATNVAESSVTVEGVTAVVDSGLRRAPVRDLSGLSPLRTVRASRSSVDQRAGRAGRLGPGRVLRLWDSSVDESLADVDPPEIESVELDDLVLQLAIWGADPHQMTWLTEPKAEDLDAATSTLQQLGFVDRQARPTELGRTAAGLGVTARLAKVALELAPCLGAVETACLIAVIESGARGELIDLASAERKAPSRQTEQLARRIGEATGGGTDESLGIAAEASGPVTGRAITAAFPQLIARRRPDGRYLLACGRGASSPAFSAEWLAVTAVSGQGPDVRIDAAAEIDRATAVTASPPSEATEVQWNAQRRVALARTRTHIGAIELSADVRPPTNAEALEALQAYVRANGIEALDDQGRIASVVMRWNAVAALVQDMEPIEPDLLADDIGWLADYTDLTKPLGASTVASAILAGRSWDASLRLDDLAPTRMTTPIGSARQIDWSSGVPVMAAPLQEFLGCTKHPAVAGGRLPVTLELLSPAMRPVQRTTDIAGFWRGTYADVRKELRGRYPKHHWPDNPETAEPWRPGMPKRPS
ncbi:MAG: hypothetical protein KDB16_16690, partial [Acidimicrobiales bacterium]|nr:hypothetical protein [Acidimicrobiales bacterium]